MSRKTILMYADCTDNRVGQTIPYMEFANLFGSVVLVHPHSDLDKMIELGDMLIVPGGLDVNAVTYDTVPSFYNTRGNPHYEYLDKHLTLPFIRTNKPVVGICRGAQVINNLLGGILFQDIEGHVQTKPRTETTEIMYLEGSNKTVEINSFHHQSIRKLGHGLELVGYSDAYKNCPAQLDPEQEKDVLVRRKGKDMYYMIVEAYKSDNTITDHKILGFQYHPEEIKCPFAISEIDKLLNNA